MTEKLFGLRPTFDYSLLIIAACFLSSSFVLGLYHLPWSSSFSCILLTLLAFYFFDPSWSTKHRFFYLLAPVMLSLASVYFHFYIASLLVSGWLYLLSVTSNHKNRWILRQFSFANLLFLVVEVLLLKHSTIVMWLNDLVHSYTRLIRESREAGHIAGPYQIQYRLLVYSIIALIPLGVRSRISFILPICQVLLIILLIPWLCYNDNILGALPVVVCSCLLVLFMKPSSSGNKGTYQFYPEWQRRTVWAARIAGFAYLILLVAVGAWSAYQRHLSPGDSLASSQHRSILFVNDRSREEGDDLDMTHFESLNEAETAAEFNTGRNGPQYDWLVSRLLPALGYRVDVKSVEELSPEDYSKYRVVVLICLQNKLPVSHKRMLLDSIESGQTSLLIAGDHTDIQGVQGPFNDIAAPLGIKLNYDSLYPFGQWSTQVVYSMHPINGTLALSQFGAVPDPGVSVGGSLTLDKSVAWPLLEAADGFADLGTPNAPMFAGLGDQVYSQNEVRGGLILAAERPFGKGTIIAFGDTAFLQNSTTSRNFCYLASIFEYLTQPAYLPRGATFVKVGLACSIMIVGSLIVRFSAIYAVVSLTFLFMAIALFSTLKTAGEIISDLDSNVLVIDNSHGEVIRAHDEDRGINILLDFLNKGTSCLTLVTNAFDSIDAKSTQSILLLAPSGSLSSGEQQKLIQFVSDGGLLVYASGYYEAIVQNHWLDNFGCRITAVTLGAGQQVTLKDRKYQNIPALVEAWGMELSNDWKPIVTCFDEPICASRKFGKGHVFVFSDSYALLDGAMGFGTNSINADCFNFILGLTKDLGLQAKQ